MSPQKLSCYEVTSAVCFKFEFPNSLLWLYLYKNYTAGLVCPWLSLCIHVDVGVSWSVLHQEIFVGLFVF